MSWAMIGAAAAAVIGGQMAPKGGAAPASGGGGGGAINSDVFKNMVPMLNNSQASSGETRSVDQGPFAGSGSGMPNTMNSGMPNAMNNGMK